MKIYSVEEALETILQRKALNRIEYSPVTIEKTEEFFGHEVRPPQAVELIYSQWRRKVTRRFENGLKF